MLNPASATGRSAPAGSAYGQKNIGGNGPLRPGMSLQARWFRFLVVPDWMMALALGVRIHPRAFSLAQKSLWAQAIGPCVRDPVWNWTPSQQVIAPGSPS